MTDDKPCAHCDLMHAAALVGIKISITRLFAQIKSSEAALKLATESMEKRLALLNELRGNVITKGEFDTAHGSLVNLHNILERRILVIETSTDIKDVAKSVSISQFVALGAGVVGLIAIAVSVVLHFVK